AFDDLQKQLETDIDDKMQVTRKSLLENFDEEVHEKLRMNLNSSKDYLNRYETLLWNITRYFLKNDADFSDKELTFVLKNNPVPGQVINSGPYRIGKNINDANIYRIGHPLAQYIISECKLIQLPSSHLIFDYSGASKKISILENLVGKSGWMIGYNFTIESLEAEDHLVLTGITENGLNLDHDQCHRLFSLNALIENSDILISADIQKTIESSTGKTVQDILVNTSERNAVFFDEEMIKLDKWADDRKTSLEIELKQLDIDIKTKKAEARKLLKLEEKVKTQRQIKEMEKRRNEMRMNLYQHQDEVDQKKENLISDIETRLKQMTSLQEIFAIRWTIK
ncbi:MAG: DEAD/DEAH box helicase, partial [Bacteroidetes bacterium HGW-Bacteroidetes-21]